MPRLFRKASRPPTHIHRWLTASRGRPQPSHTTPPSAAGPGPRAGDASVLTSLALVLIEKLPQLLLLGPHLQLGHRRVHGELWAGRAAQEGARRWRLNRGSGEAEGRLGGWGLSSRPPQGRGARSLPSWTPRSEAAGLRRRGDGAGAGGAAGRAARAPAGAPPRAAGPPAGPWAGAEGRACPRGAWGGLRAHRGGPLSLLQAPWATAGHCRGLSSVTVVPRGRDFQLPFHGGGGGGQAWNQVGLDRGGCARKDPPDSKRQAFPLTGVAAPGQGLGAGKIE